MLKIFLFFKISLIGLLSSLSFWLFDVKTISPLSWFLILIGLLGTTMVLLLLGEEGGRGLQLMFGDFTQALPLISVIMVPITGLRH